MALTLSCAGAATLSSAYFVIWLTRKDIPTGDLPPLFSTTLSGVTTLDTNYANWNLTPHQPTPTMGTWNPSTTYALGDTVASASFRILSADGVSLNAPIVYRSLIAGNRGRIPDNWDGAWTCVTQPPHNDVQNKDYRVCPFGYALSPLPTKSNLASASWLAWLGHSLSWTVAAPGDVVQLVDMYVKLNYLLGSVIVPTPSRPRAYSLATNGSTAGLIANAGINAQWQCWHTSGLANFMDLTLNGFDQTAYIDGVQPGATVGSSYLSALSASGGTPPYAYAIIAGSLPEGITLNGTTGVISGTPTEAGIFDFTAQVTDSTGATATASCAAPMQCGGGGAQGNAFY